jgi:ribosome maturation factor RimP
VKEKIKGRRKFRGRLVAAEAEGITVEVEGERCEVPLAAIARANLEYDFGNAAPGASSEEHD